MLATEIDGYDGNDAALSDPYGDYGQESTEPQELWKSLK